MKRKDCKSILQGLQCIQSDKYQQCGKCPYAQDGYDCYAHIAKDARLAMEQLLKECKDDG